MAVRRGSKMIHFPTKSAQAAVWIFDVLTEQGEVDAGQMRRDAIEMGFSESTMRSGCGILGNVITEKSGDARGSRVWRLEGDSDTKAISDIKAAMSRIRQTR